MLSLPHFHGSFSNSDVLWFYFEITYRKWPNHPRVFDERRGSARISVAPNAFKMCPISLSHKRCFLTEIPLAHRGNINSNNAACRFWNNLVEICIKNKWKSSQIFSIGPDRAAKPLCICLSNSLSDTPQLLPSGCGAGVSCRSAWGSTWDSMTALSFNFQKLKSIKGLPYWCRESSSSHQGMA